MREIYTRKGLIAYVDAQDFELVSQFTWSPFRSSRTHYLVHSRHATSTKPAITILLHRLLMNPPEGMVVDHINGNGLDNRRCNLRIVTQQVNAWNVCKRGKTSQFRGVTRYPSNKSPWQAALTVDGKAVPLGKFATELEAAQAYDRECLRLRGPHAKLNFPQEVSA